MREATVEEFQAALARAGWPAGRRMATKRTQDIYYSDRGTDVASKHITYTRGKVSGTMYLVNPAYLATKEG